ncbi:unnamed protein product [Callosobruchus maculatus]|uniref:C2H2-type domain-containing protein n=1 Tax=Callosobruchus maculatus TaxID=64391 RepID=A0A653CTS7_CALMS|nr:unnamed protein product [Callosobruchus maculatus]
MEVCDTNIVNIRTGNTVQQITMQNEMLAVEEAMKKEVGEVKIKTETAEVESEPCYLWSELFGIEQTRGPTAKYANADETVVNRSKEGQSGKDWRNDLEMQDIKVKFEEDMNCGEFKIKVEEVIMKHENDDMNNAYREITVNRIKKEQNVKNCNNEHSIQDTELKLEEDVNCEESKIEFEKVIIKGEHDDLEDGKNTEIDVNRSLEITNEQNQHLKREDNVTCTQCNTAFKRKSTLDDHIVRMHPHLIASVSSKIYECTHCMYKTIMKDRLTKHMSQHYKTADNYKLRSMEITTRQNHHLKAEAKWKCKHCNTGFKRKLTMDDHIVRMHSDLIASVKTEEHKLRSLEITTRQNQHLKTEAKWKCKHCNSTAFKRKLTMDDHIVRMHSDLIASAKSADSYKLRCVQCDAVFTRKPTRDEHIIKKHPNSLASVSSKIHQCAYCTYQTVIKSQFARHMLKHPETADSYELSTCVHCNATFKSKRALDGHTLRKHPGSAGSVSTKMYECTHCTFKTVRKVDLARHMLKHPETADSYKFSTCIHCNAKYNYKIYLDDHTVRQHPEYIASVSRKIYECTQCSCKTVMKANLENHILKHPETANNYKFSTCIHCNAIFKRKPILDEHILRQHPEYIASVSSKILECTQCSYKTVMKFNLDYHVSKHPETADSYKFSTCVHCNVKYKRRVNLDNHILKQHTEYIASISLKIHECTHCAFKTVIPAHLARHMSKHPETADSYKFSTCVHCNATFKGKQALDGHMLRKHPDSIGSISTKIYECMHCAYKTCKRSNFATHILKHL